MSDDYFDSRIPDTYTIDQLREFSRTNRDAEKALEKRYQDMQIKRGGSDKYRKTTERFFQIYQETMEARERQERKTEPEVASSAHTSFTKLDAIRNYKQSPKKWAAVVMRDRALCIIRESYIIVIGKQVCIKLPAASKDIQLFTNDYSIKYLTLDSKTLEKYEGIYLFSTEGNFFAGLPIEKMDNAFGDVLYQDPYIVKYGKGVKPWFKNLADFDPKIAVQICERRRRKTIETYEAYKNSSKKWKAVLMMDSNAIYVIRNSYIKEDWEAVYVRLPAAAGKKTTISSKNYRIRSLAHVPASKLEQTEGVYYYYSNTNSFFAGLPAEKMDKAFWETNPRWEYAEKYGKGFEPLPMFSQIRLEDWPRKGIIGLWDKYQTWKKNIESRQEAREHAEKEEREEKKDQTRKEIARSEKARAYESAKNEEQARKEATKKEQARAYEPEPQKEPSFEAPKAASLQEEVQTTNYNIISYQRSPKKWKFVMLNDHSIYIIRDSYIKEKNGKIFIKMPAAPDEEPFFHSKYKVQSLDHLDPALLEQHEGVYFYDKNGDFVAGLPVEKMDATFLNSNSRRKHAQKHGVGFKPLSLQVHPEKSLKNGNRVL